MSRTLPSYVRVGPSMEGVRVTVDDGRITSIEGDRANPRSVGHVSPLAQASIAAPHGPERITHPLRRQGDALVEVSWDEALSSVGATLGALRRQEGARALALYGGRQLAHDHLGAVRTAALALGLGTPNLFSPLAAHGAAKLYAAELVLGAPTALQADVGRAHTTVLMGADQDRGGWGPLQAGSVHTQALTYFRNRRKQNRLIAVDPRRPPLAAGADEHLAPRPGTELWFLLGMAHAILLKGWTDDQYLRDHCVNVDRLRQWLEPWSPARCAEICGLDAGEISGVGLKFARSAMSVVAATTNVFQGPQATLASWAWVVIHALTANLMRPGGLFEVRGLVDLQPVVASFPTAAAPTTRVNGLRNLLLQAPGTELATEALTPGDGQVKALVVVGGCPITELPDPEGLTRALRGLELLVAFDHAASPTTQLAHWVLPTPHFWEREDVDVLDHALLPSRFVQGTAAALPGLPEARRVDDALAALAARVPRSLRTTPAWGRHLQAMGSWLSTADLGLWQDRVLSLAGLPSANELRAAGGGVDRGEHDRALWRPAHPHGRMDLAPDPLEAALAALSEPEAPAGYGLRLLVERHATETDGRIGRTDAAGEVRVHPDAGPGPGERVRVRTPWGEAELRVAPDPTLHRDAAVVSWAGAGRALIGAAPTDPFTGAPQMAGLPCRLG